MLRPIRFAAPLLTLLVAIAWVPAADEPEAAGTEAAAQPTVAANDPVLAAARAADFEYLRHVDLLVGDLRSDDQATRIGAIRTLGQLQDSQALAHVLPFLDATGHSDDEVIAAITAVRESGAPGLEALLKRLIGHNSDAVRLSAHHALDRLGGLTAADHKARATDRIDAVRASAASNLGLLKHTEAAPILVDALRHDERAHVRRMAAIALGRLGDTANAPVLLDSLTDSNRGVRRCAGEALVLLDYKPAIPHLLMALEANIAGPDLDRCLERLSGEDFGFDSRANALDRTAAIERGFAWYAVHAKDFEAR